ncbi:sn-glycerol-3-phosphate ABC transporter ATP-binding protein UgpC [Persicimonas caeni]|uniref:sn-glycerol-3-phosphate ABC transporter ATP-binding protein UgpC n=1 Tax=Persicimonas caeni TaxID=2292766 RepID=A0A4Y6PQ80_PERCE|nr:sn-glycerol-3-phosphate ABC transporter ATP-binding protein UgpC [Persicimonas caeni]QDG50259.1 sn-glycerol-3-phosphate ABC transporter ATP-binding protein UgpC [Persicimonas caeni]QED31480.1 sn-glycerol-3-phosphate ABC transporter ATP-binding protein UgpC [Persicimonas caeni]
MATAPKTTQPQGAIDLRDLIKSYGDTEVLKGINLTIAPGEFLVLVGPSGCGKSTLLRCIAGLEEITGGDLVIDGRKCNDVHPKDRDLAMVFQSYALYPHMTVAENLAFSLTVRKFDDAEIEKRVAEVAERLGLTPLLGRRSKQLSGGQRQRVAVGRAIVREPKAFLFDEPLSNLDAALRGKMRIELKKLHHDLGATMIYVTHDQVEAMTLADRIVVLEGGHVQQVGSPTELFENPSNIFVAGFIGSPPMNFLSSEPSSDLRVAGEGFELALSDRFKGVDLPAEVTAGVRPTGLVLDGDGQGRVRGRVEVVEPLGWESYVHVSIGDSEDERIVAQIPTERARQYDHGDAIELTVAAEDVHVFDSKTTQAIRPTTEERNGSV